MNLDKELKVMKGVFDREWPQFLARLPALLRRGPTPRSAIWMLSENFTDPVLVDPAGVTQVILPMHAMIEAGMADEDAEVRAGVLRADPASFNSIDLANIFECVGGTLSPSTHAIICRWFSNMRATSDDYDTSAYWSTYFGSLALGHEEYRRGTGTALGSISSPPTPGATFGPQTRALLKHLAAAVENRSPFEVVRPAWEEFIERFPSAREMHNVDAGTLLWVARVVYQRIAGAPLGTVAQRLHDDMWRLAAR